MVEKVKLERQREEQRKERARTAAEELEGLRFMQGVETEVEGSGLSEECAAVEVEVQAQVRALRAIEDLGERKRRVAQLRLRWHPDKNQMFQGLAEQVTKMLNTEFGC
eukprot:TRINITY_DN10348_c0_g1_i4.p2 TRINITY_DN10348_c0_g1~~TRINITY_DN10348_c0_g1_i4.p2  ORF type:complete len:108 (+),score=24.77 TRINITY_DN10348_c0_g1_i4:673-996(+)